MKQKRNDFDPWRVASVLGWLLLFVAVCMASAWSIARSFIEYFASRSPAF